MWHGCPNWVDSLGCVCLPSGNLSLLSKNTSTYTLVFPFFFFFSSSGDDGGKELLGCSAPVGGLCYPLLFLPPRPSGRTVRTLTNHHPLYSLPACLPACRLYRGKVISPGAPCLSSSSDELQFLIQFLQSAGSKCWVEKRRESADGYFGCLLLGAHGWPVSKVETS